MPGGNATGPFGMGPMTGRAAGYCAGFGVPGYVNPLAVRGFLGRGRGRGGGRGWRNRFYATGLTGWQRGAFGWPGQVWGWPDALTYEAPGRSGEQQLRNLQAQAGYLEDALDGIRKRIEELEARGREA